MRLYAPLLRGRNNMELRFAREENAPMLRKIYAQYINTPITFETSLPSEEEFRARIGRIGRFYPYLSAAENGEIVGYAYAAPWQERPAYVWGAELSVYVSESVRSRGLGSALYGALLELLRLQGIRTAYAAVTVPNERSEALHRKFGFRAAAVFRNAGYKGGWRDVCGFEKRLALCEGEPAPPLSVHELNEAEEIFKKYSF